jgi:hypothetical protein
MFAIGTGPNTRTTEIFITMPGISQDDLGHLGENSWETPFGVIEGDVIDSLFAKLYDGYVDAPPAIAGESNSHHVKLLPHDMLLISSRVVSFQGNGCMIPMVTTTFAKTSPT